MTTAVYCRVSTDDKGQDPLNQLMQMPAHQMEFVDYGQVWRQRWFPGDAAGSGAT